MTARRNGQSSATKEPQQRLKRVPMPKFIKRIGVTLSLDHHSQGLLLALAAILLVLRAWWSLPGLILYAIMHFQYGGASAFQHPPRDSPRPATIADLFYVTAGIAGLGLMATGVAKSVVAALG